MQRLLVAMALMSLPAVASAQPAPAQGNVFNDRLLRLSPELQRAAMRQAVTNNGQRCGRVTATRYQQPYRNMMMWTTSCAPGGDYAVYVGRDQTVQVRPCKTLAGLKLPTCRK